MMEESHSDSEAEEHPENSSSSAENCRNGEKEGMSEYEKQRISRIRENKARLEALGLPNLAFSLFGSVGKQSKAKDKGKKKAASKIREEDDEYRPSEGEDGESSSSEEDEGNKKEKGKSPLNAAELKTLSPVQRDVNELDLIDDDVSLQQAIALSLGGQPEDLPAVLGGFSRNSSTSKNDAGRNGRQDGVDLLEATRRRKRRKSSISRVQLTEDEVVAYFLFFDEAGKGKITVRDLQRVAEAHDFTWTDKEITDMIDCFDTDRDRKLSLGDFRMIVARCNMMQASENVEMGVKY